MESGQNGPTLDFAPTVPVFDANLALGRRHDRAVSEDTAEGTLKEMDRLHVERALVYSPHAANFDSSEGNRLLMRMVAGVPRLVPQFVVNPAYDDLNSFAHQVSETGVRSLRMFPILHAYPFRDWMIGPWLDWLAEERLPVWLPIVYEDGSTPPGILDPNEVFETLRARPSVTAVLTEVEYKHFSWAIQLLRSLPNLHIELSRWFIMEGIPRLLAAVGDGRILYGSRFPDGAMGPQLYNLHNHDLSKETLARICAGNLERLLGTS